MILTQDRDNDIPKSSLEIHEWQFAILSVLLFI